MCYFLISLIFFCNFVCYNEVSSAGPTVLNIPQYKAEDVTYDDGGFGPLFNLARTFINLALPNSDHLIQDVIDIIKGTKSVDLDYLLDLVKGTFLSYSICIAVGLLFFIIFPFVGCCFCCCRVFCQCCCAKPEVEDPKASCKKKIYSMFLFMLVAVTAAGNICIYVSNDRISKAIDNAETTVTDNLDDVNTFIDYTLKQVDSMMHDFNDTKLQVHKKLDPNILNKTLSDEALSILTTGAVGNLQQEVNVLTKAVDGIKIEYATLKTACQHVPFCNATKLPNINIPIPASLKDIQGEATKTLQSKISSTVTSVATEFGNANQELDDISGTVYSSVSSMKSVLTDLNGFDTDSIKDTVKTYVEFVKPYDKYRWYAGIGCAGMVSLILSLHLFGMLCGACGRCGSGDDPTDKGCLSNSGGRMMIASDAFLFPFCTILMLVTTVLFIPGSLWERYLCQPLMDPDLKVFDTVLKDFVDLDSILKYDSASKPTFGELLRNCQNNEAVYKAFNVEHLTSVNINLTEVEGKAKSTENNIRKSINNTLGNLLTNGGTFSSVSLLPIGLSNDMQGLNSINVSSIKSQLHMIDSVIQALSALPQPSSVASDVQKIKNSRKNMEMHFQSLSDSQNKMGSLVTAVEQQLQNATTNIRTAGMTKIAKSFVDNTFKTVDNFLQDTVDTVRTKFGQCRPVWNLYNSVIEVSLCKYCADSFNGFWFSIGWCIFFLLPTAIFGTKLSNLIRNVDYYDEMDSVDSEGGRNNYERNITSTRNSLQRKLGPNRNKVRHQDM